MYTKLTQADVRFFVSVAIFFIIIMTAVIGSIFSLMYSP